MLRLGLGVRVEFSSRVLGLGVQAKSEVPEY